MADRPKDAVLTMEARLRMAEHLGGDISAADYGFFHVPEGLPISDGKAIVMLFEKGLNVEEILSTPLPDEDERLAEISRGKALKALQE